jgi:2'-hydroxyisoflavone reductase
MKLLLLGGTGFLSGHLVSAALLRGHEVTLFHRGRTNPGRFPDVEHILGDREKDLELLGGRHWDAAIDPCGYLPRVVEASSSFLASAVDHYTFISSVSAYAELGEAVVDESAPLAILAASASEEITDETYGPYKALCEQAAERAMPGRVLIIRPGLLIGPADASGRFTYWPRRIARGGEVLAPDNRNQPVEFVDARDVADWIIALLERQQVGTYNASGPAEHLTLQSFLEQAAAVIGSKSSYTWVSEEFLLAHQVKPWTELPLWIPQEEGNTMSLINFQKAVSAGLIFRPLAQTIRDVLAWGAAHPNFPVSNATLTPEKESALLREWHDHEHV